MEVITRSGKREKVSFDKVIYRLTPLCEDLDPKYVDPILIALDTIKSMYSGISTEQLDNLSADICASKISLHPDFNKLAARIAVSNLHKETKSDYNDVVCELYELGLLSDEFYKFVTEHHVEIQQMIDYSRDFLFDFFGFKTLERSYLMRNKTGGKNRIVERPQHLWMRVAVQIHGVHPTADNDIKQTLMNIKETYDGMSQLYFTQATPTLFNSGTKHPQLSSCFLLGIDDNIENIFKTIGDIGKISKWAGGIGIHITDIRAKGSLIKGTNGKSDGIIPLCKVMESVGRYINQGGKRNGSIACYLEPWHADVFEFVELRKNTGDENLRARDLFLAMWIPDLFMKRVQANEKWSLMCPDKCPGLSDVYGEEFETLYTRYESEGRYNKQVLAADLWKHILEAQIETGMPYISYKDHVNLKSNQKNIGVIKSSNLCVSGDTMILTKDGYYPIVELQDKDVQVWNGKKWSKTTVKKTGENQKLLKINFSNGMSVDCTEYHKFYIETGKRPADKSRPVVIEAKDLKQGMKLIRYELDIVDDNKNDMEMPYTHGLFCADGTYSNNKTDQKRCNYKRQEGSNFCGRHLKNTKKYDTDDDICCAVSLETRPLLSLYNEKINLLQYIDYDYHGSITNPSDTTNKLTLSLPFSLEPKYYVPINNSIQSKIKWLEGFFDGDGCVIENNGIKNIQAASIHLDFLKNIVFMLQTLGVNSYIGIMAKDRKTVLPDGHGGKKEYECKLSYRINIDSIGLKKLMELGFSPKRLDISNSKLPHHITNRYIKISSIEDNQNYGDTYCFNEPEEHKGIFNGIILGNCNEIVEVSNTEETAVCNLASICLPKFVEGNAYNFQKLRQYAKIATRNLNNVIDTNFYPTPETRYSNMKNRPVGLGVQGLADVYCKLRLPFDSQEAKDINRKIFEHIYFASLETSCELAQKDGPYKAFDGSPFSQGLLQWHLWGVDPATLSPELDWEGLAQKIKVHGTRNSLLTALMPTASTSQIMKNCECIEPYSSNIFVRTTLAGEYIIVNEHLVRDLLDLGLWTKEIYNEIIYFNGSVQKIKEIPQNIKDLYKTAFEIKGVDIVKQSVDRGPFIDQTQSLNIFQAVPDFSKLSSSHFYGWKNGLKTGMYYLRTQPAVDPIKFGLDPLEVRRIREKYAKTSGSADSSKNETGENRTPETVVISLTSIPSVPREEEAPRVCPLRRPGQRLEDCLACGS